MPRQHGYTYDESTYDKHTAVKFGCAFRAAGTLTTPGTLQVDVIAPDGTLTTYTPADPELDNPVTADISDDLAELIEVTSAENSSPWTGIAVLEITLDQEGDWRVRWKADGTVTVAKELVATVRKTPFA